MASITLYNCSDENERVLKNNLSNALQLTGNFRSEVSVMNPVVQIESANNLSGFNYAYITEFGRYYYITEIKAIRTNLWQFTLKVDVLMSYHTEILSQTAVIRRNANLFNLYLNDNQYQTLNYSRIQTKLFPNGFGDWNFVLTTVGKGGTTGGGT